MDIFMHVNNRADYFQFPIMPENFAVTKPQKNGTFETATLGELKLYGTPGLQSISWSSFFPIRDYPFNKNRTMWGMDYVNKLDSWIEKKLPMRLLITADDKFSWNGQGYYSSPPCINWAVVVDSFDWDTGPDGNINYTLGLTQFPMFSAQYGVLK